MSSEAEATTVKDEQLQQQLAAKDQLVRALTDRLEEAAEQLDRVHRTGGDKGGRTVGGSESGGSASPLLEKISRSLQAWDEVDPGEAFGRIEERLDELREMLEGAVVSGGGAQAAPKKSDTLSGWEKMKAQLMEGDGSAAPAKPSRPQPQSAPTPKPAPTPETAGETPEADEPAPQPAQVKHVEEPRRPITELQLPEPVDFETAITTELHEAIEVRDQYIGELSRRLRSAESRTQQPVDWEVLNNAPDDLREKLQQLEAELTDTLRIAEVDLSLERARLSRVETRIRDMQRKVEKKLQQSIGAVANTESPAETKKDKLAKSWFGTKKR